MTGLQIILFDLAVSVFNANTTSKDALSVLAVFPLLIKTMKVRTLGISVLAADAKPEKSNEIRVTAHRFQRLPCRMLLAQTGRRWGVSGPARPHP